jgi:hypothetical protein
VDNLANKTVENYITAMNEAIKAGYKVLVIDSLSHAWRELTDEVDRIAQHSTSKNTFSPWAKVNPKQKRFIEAILNFPGHIIATMRSNTEWVIYAGENGKTAPQRIGLKPEQGKGIEFEFDLLMELDQNHQATVIKDRTGKYQDAVIDKPGEDFGLALYEWLASGKAEIPTVVPPKNEPSATTHPPKQATPKSKTPATKTPPPKANPLKEQGDKLVNEIGEVFNTVSPSGKSYFSEDEKAEGRSLVTATRLDEAGIKDLEVFKDFIAEELQKRQAEKAA